MLNKIKALADEAIALQNKNRMDEVLREISALCEAKEPEKSMDVQAEKEVAEKKQRKGAKDAE